MGILLQHLLFEGMGTIERNARVWKYYKLKKMSFTLSVRIGFAEIQWISYAGGRLFRLVVIIDSIVLWCTCT